MGFLIGVLVAVGAFVLVLGILVLIHEFGHFAAAKYFKVRVEVFSIGFGKRLFGFKRGDTDYRIAALPLGGYVKMSGENPLEPATGDPGEFMSHPRWQRFVIALAGPAMNIVFAIALMTAIFMVHYEHPIWWNRPADVGWVMDGSAGDKAGIQPGDRIVRIDGVQNPTWQDVLLKGFINPGQPVSIAVQRNGQLISTTITPDKVGPQEVGNTGLVPSQPNEITTIQHEMPAYQAGLRLGDQILTVDGVPVNTTQSLLRQLQRSGDKPTQIIVLRDGQQMNFTVKPVLLEIEGDKKYRIGVLCEPVQIDKLPFSAALNRSLEENWKSSFLMVELLQKMVKRQISIKQLSGPVGIAGAAGEAAKEGMVPLLTLMALISLQLGIFNLLPIPIMDGGVILLLLIEGLMRRDINARIKERIYQAAFVFLVLFAVVVIYNDIAKLPGIGH
ncbi:MAG TPA: RIP metalloprotease RseP [Croceibacterium sp.]|nr:RIP metalloprotease RseP [Croceibacterium sp.]